MVHGGDDAYLALSTQGSWIDRIRARLPYSFEIVVKASRTERDDKVKRYVLSGPVLRVKRPTHGHSNLVSSCGSRTILRRNPWIVGYRPKWPTARIMPTMRSQRYWPVAQQSRPSTPEGTLMVEEDGNSRRQPGQLDGVEFVRHPRWDIPGRDP